MRCPVAGPCAALPAGTEAWVFPVGPVLGGVDLTTRGTHTVRVFASDTGAPCDSAPELMVAGFVIP